MNQARFYTSKTANQFEPRQVANSSQCEAIFEDHVTLITTGKKPAK
jgi:hypothetical protein